MPISAEAIERHKPEQIQRTYQINNETVKPVVRRGNFNYVLETKLLGCMLSTQRLKVMFIHYTSNEILLTTT